MVKGLDHFRERFRAYDDAFVLIGGAACDVWFTRQGLAFRPTQDLDIVLVIEVLDAAFVGAMRQYIAEGQYRLRHYTADGPPVLYRFAKPEDDRFPKMLELFSKKPEALDLRDDQQIVPVATGSDAHSLSAILVNADYYELIRAHAEKVDGIAFATATALIPLKARAWIDLTQRKLAGETIDADDILKHRNDVFRLAATLAATAGPALPAAIRSDLIAFLEAFPEDAAEWEAILASLKNTFGGGIAPATLRSTLNTYFLLS
jgi:hypothetical protein